MAEQTLGLKELLANCVLVKDFRHAFTADPDKFLQQNPQYRISPSELEQLKAFKIQDWDTMQLQELNDWLIKAGEISRPAAFTVSVP